MGSASGRGSAPRRSSQAAALGRPSDRAPSVFGIVSAHSSDHGSRRPRRFRLFRKCLFGYQPREVDQAIELRDAAILERDAALHEAGQRAIETTQVEVEPDDEAADAPEAGAETAPADEAAPVPAEAEN